MDQSIEQSADRSMDQDGWRWLTYPELSAVRGIDKPSAIRLATRKKWRRQRDNRRVVRVLVPPEWLAPRYRSMDQPIEQPDRDMDLSSDRTDFAAALAAVEAAHAGEVAALHGQIAGLATVADRTLAQLAEANFRADRAEDATDDLRRRVAAMQHDLDAARAEAQEAAQTIEALRREASARQARGLVARLRAAWRGE